LFKLCIALAFGLVAAFAIGLAGLLADVSLAAVFLRSLVGFLLAGLLSYLVAFVLEAKEWANFDKEGLLNDLSAEGEEKGGAGEEGPPPVEAADAPAEEEAEGQGFTPFSAENLNRIEPP
jgi:hypothetical protein